MSMDLVTLAGKLHLAVARHSAYANLATEKAAIATLLGSDVTKHGTTIETAAPGLIPGVAANSHFTNNVLRWVNIAKAGNLTAAQIATAVTAAA
jgi:hypothetical protein